MSKVSELQAKIDSIKTGIDNPHISDSLKPGMKEKVKELEAKLKESQDEEAAEQAKKEAEEKAAEKAMQQAQEEKDRLAAEKKSKVRKQVQAIKPKGSAPAAVKAVKKVKKKVKKQRKAKHKPSIKHGHVRAPKAAKRGKKRVKSISLKLPKKVKSFNRGRSKADLFRDRQRLALPPGKRITKWGTVYYEHRPNRSDISSKARLEDGGPLDELSTQLIPSYVPEYIETPAGSIPEAVSEAIEASMGREEADKFLAEIRDLQRMKLMIKEIVLNDGTVITGDEIRSAQAGDNMTPEQRWNSWDMGQREHFLFDHIPGGDDAARAEQASLSYEALPEEIKEKLSEHLRMPKYRPGGLLNNKKIRGFNKNRSASNLHKDKKLKALPPGARISKRGHINQFGKTKGGHEYREYRANRSDVLPRQKLAGGGTAGSIAAERTIHGKYVTMTVHPSGISLKLTPEGIEKAKEDTITERNFWDYFEDIQVNSDYSYAWNASEVNIGMTEAPVITTGYYMDGDDADKKADVNAKVYAFMAYETTDFTQKLAEGESVFFPLVSEKHHGGKFKKGGSPSDYWIQESLKHKGSLRKKAKQMGLIKGDEKLSFKDLDKLEKQGGVWKRKAETARTLMHLHHTGRKPSFQKKKHKLGGKPGHLSKYYYLVVNLDERGEYSASVLDDQDNELWSVETDYVHELIEDGFLKYKPDQDLGRLSAYLSDMGVIPKDARVISMMEQQRLYAAGGGLSDPYFRNRVQQLGENFYSSKQKKNITRILEKIASETDLQSGKKPMLTINNGMYHTGGNIVNMYFQLTDGRWLIFNNETDSVMVSDKFATEKELLDASWEHPETVFATMPANLDTSRHPDYSNWLQLAKDILSGNFIKEHYKGGGHFGHGKHHHSEKMYLYDGKEYTGKKLVDFVNTSSFYDREDEGEPEITTVEDAILYLGVNQVKVIKEGHEHTHA